MIHGARGDGIPGLGGIITDGDGVTPYMYVKRDVLGPNPSGPTSGAFPLPG
jgi:hypothetical protein